MSERPNALNPEGRGYACKKIIDIADEVFKDYQKSIDSPPFEGESEMEKERRVRYGSLYLYCLQLETALEKEIGKNQ